jgi:phosphinothricin acetyltransferase
MPEIRPGELRDAEAINDLYNHYIRHTPITFDIDEITIAARREWIARHGTGPHRLLVAAEDGAVLGYASSGPWRPKQAYETSIETSVYLHPAATGRGLGTALYKALFEAIRDEDVHRALAGITMPNEASVALHERFGFTLVGVFTEQGRKFGRFWDVAWYEKPLGYEFRE